MILRCANHACKGLGYHMRVNSLGYDFSPQQPAIQLYLYFEQPEKKLKFAFGNFLSSIVVQTIEKIISSNMTTGIFKMML